MDRQREEDLLYDLRDALDVVMGELPPLVWFDAISSAVSGHLKRELADLEEQVLLELVYYSPYSRRLRVR